MKKKLKLYKKCEGEGQRRINYWNNAMIFIWEIFLYFVIQYSAFLSWEKNKNFFWKGILSYSNNQQKLTFKKYFLCQKKMNPEKISFRYCNRYTSWHVHAYLLVMEGDDRYPKSDKKERFLKGKYNNKAFIFKFCHSFVITIFVL